MTALGVLAIAVAVVGIAVRHIPITHHGALLVAVAAPFLALFAPIAFACMVAARRWALVIVALCVTAASVVPLLAGYFGSTVSHADHTRVRIMTANLEYGGADAYSLVREARSRSDLLALQELTYDSVGRLEEAGLEETFPFKTLYPQHDAGGVGLWSRYPIASSRLVSGFQMPLIDADVRTRPGDDSLRLLVVHLGGPWPQPITGWQRDIAQLDATLRRVADEAESNPVVVAGDFNATTDLRPFRDLLRHGYGNAAQQAGEGRLPTFPNGAMIPPALDIDHILTRDCAASSAGTIPLHGSDHRALIATVEFSAPAR